MLLNIEKSCSLHKCSKNWRKLNSENKLKLFLMDFFSFPLYLKKISISDVWVERCGNKNNKKKLFEGSMLSAFQVYVINFHLHKLKGKFSMIIGFNFSFFCVLCCNWKYLDMSATQHRHTFSNKEREKNIVIIRNNLGIHAFLIMQFHSI